MVLYRNTLILSTHFKHSINESSFPVDHLHRTISATGIFGLSYTGNRLPAESRNEQFVREAAEGGVFGKWLAIPCSEVLHSAASGTVDFFVHTGYT